MHIKLTFAAAVCLLGACTQVANETRTPQVIESGFYAGERYELRSRTLNGPNGSYEKTSVVYKGLARSCIRDSPNDCQSKARRLVEEYDELFF